MTSRFHAMAVGLAVSAAAVAGASWGLVWRAPVATGQPFHPDFALLDADKGLNVLASGGGVDDEELRAVPRRRLHCPSRSTRPGPGCSVRVLPFLGRGPGLFGQWDPLRPLPCQQRRRTRIDLSTPDWLMISPARGGRWRSSGTTSRDGQPLTPLAPSPNPETLAHLDARAVASLVVEESGTWS